MKNKQTNSQKNIQICDFKNLLKENNDIIWFKWYVKKYINHIIFEKNEFSKEDFLTLEDFISSKSEYSELLKIYNDDFSYELLDILSKWKNIDEFKNDFSSYIHIFKYKNKEVLSFMIDFLWIEDISDLNNFMFSNKELLAKLSDVNTDNLNYIIKLFEITNLDWLSNFLKENNVWRILSDKNLDLFKAIIKSKSDFLEINRKMRNFRQENMNFLLRISKDNDIENELIDFIENKVLLSDSLRNSIFLSEINFDNKFENIFTYKIKNKPKAIKKLFDAYKNIQYFQLDIKIDNLNSKDLEFNQDTIKADFIKILDKNCILNKKDESFKNEKIKEFDDYINSNNEKWIEKLLMENLVIYFNWIYHEKLKLKISDELKSNLLKDNKEIDLEKIDSEKLERPEFLEAYKMAKNPKYNKEQINHLLIEYLHWDFDKLDELNQYKTEKNQDWLKKNLSQEQSEIWLSKNTKVIDLWEYNLDKERIFELNEIKEKSSNHFKKALKYIDELNKIWFNFDKINDLNLFLTYYKEKIKTKKEEIISKNPDLYKHINDEIKILKKLKDLKKEVSLNKIIIERELDPLKSLMMWNWVDWSLLSYNSKGWNYYSAISNTIDANKWVYYIKDEKWNIIWRCLVAIWEDKKISRYKMYYNWKISSRIDNFFSVYVRNLAKDMKLDYNWDPNKVINIESDFWYIDTTKII